MKAFILTEEEIENLANGTLVKKDIDLDSKQVKTWLVMPDFNMPTWAQKFYTIDEPLMDKAILKAKLLKPKQVARPFAAIVGKMIDRL